MLFDYYGICVSYTLQTVDIKDFWEEETHSLQSMKNWEKY